MENLTKQQIILLTLLVSFVTSIATGIVTVALMNQAPVGVVQTINRVVEKTIQTVSTPGKETIVKETVMVNPDDQIVSAVDKNSKSIIRIFRTNIDPSSGLSSIMFVGLGVAITTDGVIVTDSSLIADNRNYFTTTGENKLLDLSVVRSVSGEKVALLKIKNDDLNSLVFSKANISKDDLKLGQTVIYMGGETKSVVSTGIVSSLSVKEIKPSDNATSTPTSKISSIETSISSSFISGGLLLNLSGELVGIKSNYMDSAKTDLFAPASNVNDSLSLYLSSAKKSQ